VKRTCWQVAAGLTYLQKSEALLLATEGNGRSVETTTTATIRPTVRPNGRPTVRPNR
jgi:hypothetical protein